MNKSTKNNHIVFRIETYCVPNKNINSYGSMIIIMVILNV